MYRSVLEPYYVFCAGPVMPGVVRCGEHADYGTITFLVQDNLGGLEVKGKASGDNSEESQWLQATPVPQSILASDQGQPHVIPEGHII